MNICIVSNFKQSGYGESTRPGQIAKYLKLFGHNVLHICDWQGEKEGIQHLQIARETWEKNRLKRWWKFAKDYVAIARFKPDLVYAHQFNNAKWALQTKLFAGMKIFFDAHTSIYFESLHFAVNSDLLQLMQTQEAHICQKADFIITASAETKKFLTETYSLNPGKSVVVGNATDLLPIEEVYIPSNKKFICLTTLPQDGFPANEMALEMFMDVAAKTYEVNRDIEFHVIGGGRMPEPRTPNVIFDGYVADLRKTILQADICIMPFPQNAVCGGARNKFCDYIALGKVVVTTPEGLRGMEVLQDLKNCLVAEDVPAMTNTIIELAGNSAKIAAIGQNVFLLRNYFNWQARSRQVESVFTNLVTK